MRFITHASFLLVCAAPMAAALLIQPGGKLGANGPSTGQADVSYLSQGWSAAAREKYHYLSQGSELIPYFWFLNLQKADGSGLLRDDLEKYGFLYDNVTPNSRMLNPDHLPIGFARQREKQTLGVIAERHWLGFTCAACHTGAIIPKPGSNAIKQGVVVVDGAPANSDIGSFLVDLTGAVTATSNDPARLRLLAQKVLSAGDGSSIADIESRFKKYGKELELLIPLYVPPTQFGPARLDAFGAIFNRVAVFDIKSNQTPPGKLDAPVSFPFIWYTDRQDHIQWNGEQPNANWLNRLERNVGEVCGVFAQVVVKPNAGIGGYPSSINVAGLGRIDRYISNLKSPKWTDVFPAPDPAAVQRGKAIFRQSCQSGGCHQDLAAKGKVAKVGPTPLRLSPNNNPAHLPNLNTDENNTKLVHSTLSATGILEGTPTYVVAGKPLKAPVNVAVMVTNVVIGGLLGEKGAALEAYFEYVLSKIIGDGEMLAKATPKQVNTARRRAKADVTNAAMAAYKMMSAPGSSTQPPPSGFDPYTAGYESRSMNGIWATAPYLHNGSVPNLFELLWPKLRSRTFYVGSLVFDPQKVGYVSDGTEGGKLFDTKLPGNSNTGHTYGYSLSKAQKEDLIAYLKSQ